jgi:hypothetical protein
LRILGKEKENNKQYDIKINQEHDEMKKFVVND